MSKPEDKTAPTPLPMIERRRIEAEILKHVYETVKERDGADVARAIVAEAVRRSSIEQGQKMAAMTGDRKGIEAYASLLPLWTMEDALRMEVLAQTDKELRFNITRCRYAEMYREMGLGDIGGLLSCQRDGTFCEGYDPKLKLKRTQTIMEGASHCDFHYTYDEKGRD